MKFSVRNSDDRERVISYIGRLPDKPYDINIDVHRVKRSTSQNALYWLWLDIVADETGNSRDELHDVFRTKFLPVAEHEVLGVVVRELPTTTKLSTDQFTTYLNQIEVFCNTELGIVLPHPEDLFWADIAEKYGY